MLFHIIELNLQFVFINPIIVPFTKGDILPFCTRELERSPDAYPFGILVFRLINRFEKIRESGLVLADDVRRPVGGGIIMNEDFKREAGLLHDKTIETLPDERLVVKGLANDADQGMLFHKTDRMTASLRT